MYWPVCEACRLLPEDLFPPDVDGVPEGHQGGAVQAQLQQEVDPQEDRGGRHGQRGAQGVELQTKYTSL